MGKSVLHQQRAFIDTEPNSVTGQNEWLANARPAFETTRFWSRLLEGARTLYFAPLPELSNGIIFYSGSEPIALLGYRCRAMAPLGMATEIVTFAAFWIDY
jgi:hypothetical protein